MPEVIDYAIINKGLTKGTDYEQLGRRPCPLANRL